MDINGNAPGVAGDIAIIEADITALEDKTQNQTAVANKTTFTTDIITTKIGNAADDSYFTFGTSQMQFYAPTIFTQTVLPLSDSTYALGSAGLRYTYLYSDNCDMPTGKIQTLISNDVDTESSQTLFLGKATTSRVEIGNPGIITDIEGPCEIAGTLTMASTIAMGANKITGAGDPTNNQDVATKKYVDDNTVDITGDTMTGSLTTTAVIFPKPHAEIWMESNTTATTISASNTWTKVAGTTSKGFSQSFDATTTNNKIVYTGTMDKTFHCGVTFSVDPASSADTEWIVCLSKNGAPLGGSTVRIHTLTAGDHVSSAIHKFVSLQTNDYLELYIQNLTNANNITFSEFNLFALALPNEVSILTVGDLVGWYDASDSSSMSQSAGNVAEWNDLSGNGNNLTGIVATPRTGDTTQNSLNVVDFDGSECIYHTTGAVVNYNNHTIIMVTNAVTSTDTDLFGSGNASDGNVLLYVTGTNKFRGHHWHDATSNSTDSTYTLTTGWGILVQRAGDTTLDLIQNGDNLDLANAKTGTLDGPDTGIYIGSRDTTPATGINGSVGEVLIFERALNDQDLNYVCKKLATKWGITWTDFSSI